MTKITAESYASSENRVAFSDKVSSSGNIVNVEPIRSIEDIRNMREALGLAKEYGRRNQLLFTIGINTGLRIGDIVKLRIEDVRGKTQLTILEGKTKKRRIVYLYDIMADIAEYVESLADEGKPLTGYLFASRKGDKSISTTQAYRILTEAGRMIGRDDIGTHSLRKTFGYHYYQRTKDIATLMVIFNHSSQDITKRYIGITDSEIAASLRGFRL